MATIACSLGEAPATTHITLRAGDTIELNVEVTTQNGDPQDLTGASLAWKAARSPTSPVLISKSTDSGITYTDQTHGKFKIALAPIDTAALVGDLHHEIEITDFQGNKSTVLRAWLTIVPTL